MRNPHRLRSHTPGPSAERGLTEMRRAWTLHPRAELISDGVIAGYIHGISARHADALTGPRRRRRGDQG